MSSRRSSASNKRILVFFLFIYLIFLIRYNFGGGPGGAPDPTLGFPFIIPFYFLFFKKKRREEGEEDLRLGFEI